eukprot:5643522-Pyramimonas_sp.AAC.1
MRSWLEHHPAYSDLAASAPATAAALTVPTVAELFMAAAARHPEDADVHTVLGVVYNLSREYGKATEAFRQALVHRPHDYSLWNKLGATQACPPIYLWALSIYR